MLNRTSKGRGAAWAISSILLVSFALLTANIRAGKGPATVEAVLMWSVAPLQSGFSRAAQWFADGFRNYFLLVDVAKENQRLKADIDALIRQKNVLLEKLSREERLRALTDNIESLPGRELPATIIGRDATQWSKVLFINKGSNDGVRENHAVVTNLGVIGHVIQTNTNTAKVMLITDNRSAVDALFQDSRGSGVVVGSGGKLCEMNYVPMDAVVEVGDKVISSGLGGTFPKGLVIGTISHVTKKRQGLFQEVIITPSVDLQRLEEVLVLIPQ